MPSIGLQHIHPLYITHNRISSERAFAGPALLTYYEPRPLAGLRPAPAPRSGGRRAGLPLLPCARAHDTTHDPRHDTHGQSTRSDFRSASAHEEAAPNHTLMLSQHLISQAKVDLASKHLHSTTTHRRHRSSRLGVGARRFVLACAPGRLRREALALDQLVDHLHAVDAG